MNTKAEKTKKVDIKSAKPDYGFSGGFLTIMQNVGKSLVFPIAVLPMAAILLRIGSLLTNNNSVIVKWIGIFMKSPGDAVFNNLPIIFAIGVAFGFSKDHRGEAALVGALAYFTLHIMVETEGSSFSYLFYHKIMTVTGKGGKEYSQLLYLVPITDVSEGIWLLDMGVFAGIEAGLIAAYAYNRWAGKQLHPSLAFFSGRRFVPMIILVIMAFVSVISAIIWPWLQLLLILFAQQVVVFPALGAGFYGFFNRLMIPFGLHHVLNVFFWFQFPITVHGLQLLDSNNAPIMGDINGFSQALILMKEGVQISGNASYGGIDFVAGKSYYGDEALVLLQEAHIGAFQTGFFPIMMGGVPATALAMGMAAEKERRKTTLMFMGSIAAVAFLTGITEPVEYSFMFLSPLLFFFYSLLSGLVAAGTVATGASVGFGFSAGFVDLIASIPIAIVLSTMSGYVYLVIPAIIIAVFPLYFALTYFMIKKFNIETPGRGDNNLDQQHSDKKVMEKNKDPGAEDHFYTMAKDTIKILGGVDKIREIDNCITRVRLQVDNNDISQQEVKDIGYIGYSKIGDNAAQFIIGPEAEIIARYILELKREGYDYTKDIKIEEDKDSSKNNIELNHDSKIDFQEEKEQIVNKKDVDDAIKEALEESEYIEIFFKKENEDEVSSSKKVLLEAEILEKTNK